MMPAVLTRCLFALCGVLVAAKGQTPTTLEVVHGEFGFDVTPSGLRCKVVGVPGATHAAIVAAVRVGGWHDPVGQTGLTHLLNTQVTLTQAARPESERWSVRTTGAATVLAVTCPSAAVETRLRELSRFLAGELPFDADLLARAKAQVLILADDYLHSVPGPLLFETARRHVLAGTPAGKQMFGVPDELKAIEPAQLRAWFNTRMRPEHATVVVMGGVEPGAIGGRLSAGVRGRGRAHQGGGDHGARRRGRGRARSPAPAGHGAVRDRCDQGAAVE